ncbi:putative NAD(P)H nitroreductase YfhC [Paenibacillus sp. J23TS9]|uniref:nitroreductase family protein n=1 Tax=Paenibacillus sp. J23TS9 TaxID=2807193 RepID=UPI001B10F6B7|nr:nitroreductase [Paenibacillus sp. J23TS9]GIP26016.1 putative NAD(P)H nitroreductase YfhC [Paenibacillus sp. J23TS9]
MDNNKPSALAQIIRERRSVKTGYKNIPVPQELVLELLNDAVYAPNHKLREPWRFIFVPTDAKQLFALEMAQHYPDDMFENRIKYFNEPDAYLIIVMTVSDNQKQQDEDYGAVSSMIQNFQLLAWERGLGTVWKTNMHIYDPKVKEMLGVQAGEKIAGFLHLGFYNEAPEGKPRTPAEEKFTVYVPTYDL